MLGAEECPTGMLGMVEPNDGRHRPISTFFHVGVNLSLERRHGREGYAWQAASLQPDGSLPWKPLPGHDDPDFTLWTYGEPWGRVDRLRPGDYAFFIVTAKTPAPSWGYFMVAWMKAEAVYRVSRGRVDPEPLPFHGPRLRANAHFARGDPRFSVLLGDPSGSKRMFLRPVRVSAREIPLPELRDLWAGPVSRLKGYWFKKWLGPKQTLRLLSFVEAGELGA